MDTLERYARRLRHHPAFMAHVLWIAMAAEGIDESTLARQLGLNSRGLARLALCYRPRPEHFNADVQAIADYTGADPAELHHILWVFETFQDNDAAAEPPRSL